MSSLAPLTGGSALAPLQRDEIELLNRLLADPTLFPREFKRWVTDHASDTVDIAKSQVHGLVDKGGDVYIPAPPLISQVKFVPFKALVTIVTGGGSSVHNITGVETDGNPVIYEFFAPFAEYQGLKFRLYLDGQPSGIIGSYQADGPAGGPWTAGVRARSAIYLQMQFTPAKGTHTFNLDVQSQGTGGGYQYVGGGYNIYGEDHGDGFTRISRA